MQNTLLTSSTKGDKLRRIEITFVNEYFYSDVLGSYWIETRNKKCVFVVRTSMNFFPYLSVFDEKNRFIWTVNNSFESALRVDKTDGLTSCKWLGEEVKGTNVLDQSLTGSIAVIEIQH